METGETSDLWWKNAIIYCVDVETYRDANGDGIGDFAGLTVTAMRSLPPHPVSAQWARAVPVGRCAGQAAREIDAARKQGPVSLT